ncbi:unnamed protein product [Camellia sinensis]
MKREVLVVECEIDRQPRILDSVATRSDDVALVVFDSAASPPPPPPIPPAGDKKHKVPKGKGLEGNNIVNIKVLLTIRRFRLTVHRWIQGTLKLAYKTLGVVFGGLVTSPLYVYPSMQLKSPIEDDYLGIYSIMFWTLSLIGVVKYACIALRADDQGEALNSSSEKRSRLGIFFEKSVVARRVLLFIAMLGMFMLIDDGILTPAISVLSAMDDIRAPFPSVSKSLVEVLSAVVLIVLFLLQKYGTSRVSFIFSPIMGAWTVTTPLIGIYSIIRHYPSIFKAISPHYIVSFFFEKWKGRLAIACWHRPLHHWLGSEALFADLGHFNRKSIQLAFLFTIYPSLVLTYAGQTAYLIKNPNNHDDGFYKFVPKTIYWPMFIVATLAAIVASQSLISATFSIIKQSVMLDYFPRVKVVHTSSKKEGEVYCPEINYILMILCVAVILIFGDGKDIGNAFGVVVSLVMLITTILLTLVMIMIWRTPPVLVALYFIVYFVMEGVYVSAVSTKIPQGGWIPFAISFILAFIMFGWFYGSTERSSMSYPTR